MHQRYALTAPFRLIKISLAPLLWLVFSVNTLSGCSASSVFVPYPAQAQAFQNAINSPTQTSVLQSLSQQGTKADGQLYLMERGRLNQLNGDFAASQQDFAQVLQKFDEQDQEARIDLSNMGASLSGNLTNDNAIPYHGYGYERIFTHQYQALNFIAQHNMEAAAVELRAMATQQTWLEELHDAQLAKAEEGAEKKNLNFADFDRYFVALDDHVADVRRSFQSAYAHYFAAVIWESLGEYNDAWVDYKKALQIMPQNTLIQKDVERIGRRLEGVPRKRNDKGTLVVLYEQGFVPARTQTQIPIPIFGRHNQVTSFISLAFPFYAPQSFIPSSRPLMQITGHTSALQGQRLTDTSQLAVKALREKMPSIILRQVLRAITKYQLNKQASEALPGFGDVLSTLYNTISEQADLRTWLTLPHYVDVYRTSLKSGEYTLSIAGGSQIPVSIQPHRITLVRLCVVNGQLISQQFQL